MLDKDTHHSKPASSAIVQTALTGPAKAADEALGLENEPKAEAELARRAREQAIFILNLMCR
jgi:hypothetical protein